MGNRFLASAILLLASSIIGVSANRKCGSATAPTNVQWSVTDLRFDGADPRKKDNISTLSVALIPATPQTRFSCYGQWPEAWQGYFQGNGPLVWVDCLWTGPGSKADLTVSFGMDLKTQTAYVAHTYNCDDAAGRGAPVVARGSVAVALDCTSDSSGEKSCIAKLERVTMQAKQEPTRLAATSTCADNAKRDQSWIVEDFKRSYTLPETDSPTPEAAATVTGPSFTLKGAATSDVFTCTAAPSKGADTIVEGTCTGGTDKTTAKFRYDPKLIMLSVTQQWSCGGESGAASPLTATGVAYIQSSCLESSGSLRVCDLVDPFWVGSKSTSTATSAKFRF